MIRKILLFCALLFIIIWVSVAHLLKSQVTRVINSLNSDNIKISFEDTNISGFPFAWKIKLIEPKITFIGKDGLQDLLPENITFTHNLFLSEINIGNKILYQNQKENTSLNSKYILTAEQDIIIDIIYKKAIFFIKNISYLQEQIGSFNAFLPVISCLDNNKEVFRIDGVKVLVVQEKIDLIDVFKVKLVGNLFPSTEGSLQKAQVFVEMGYLINDEMFKSQPNNLNFDRKIELNNFRLKYDEAEVNIKGFVNLNRNSLPNGKLDFSLIQYKGLIDELIPDDFIISKSFIKKVISRANSPEDNMIDTGNANFTIDFSNKGINIGKLNIFDIQKND